MSKQKAAAAAAAAPLPDRISKGKYNAIYLGWKLTPGLYGVDMTAPVIHDMIYGARPDNFSLDDLPRVAISVTKKELKLTQTVTKKPGKTETLKFHVVPMKDLMFASRGASPDDCVVACIYHGFNPATKGWAHVHAYLCESSMVAENFLRHLYQYINTPYHRDRLAVLERDMLKKGHLQPLARAETPYEMGFPKISADSGIYGSFGGGDGDDGDGNVYGSDQPGGQRKGGSVSEDSQMSPFQKYLVGGDAPLRIPRVSPRPGSYSEDAQVARGSVAAEAARLGYGQWATGAAPAGYPSESGNHQLLDARRSNDGVYSSSEQLRRIAVDAPYGSSDQLRVHPANDPRVPLGARPGLYTKPGGVIQPTTNVDESRLARSAEGIYPKVANIPVSINGLRIVDNPPPPYGSAAVPQRDVIAERPDYDDEEDLAPPTVESALTAELRSKLGRGPILLPPKDYDTVRRTHGNLEGIEARKCRNEKIIGKGGEGGKDARANQFEWAGKTRPAIYDFGNG